MQIDFVVCPINIEQKFESRHHVTVREARQVLLSQPRIRFTEKGYTASEDVYVAFGQTFSVRYWQCFLCTNQPPKQRSSSVLVI